MSHKILRTLLGGVVAATAMVPSHALAVGGGTGFVFREFFVPADPHPVAADSLDLTYHSCVDVTGMNQLTERGYFWVSSFQDADSVVDSQINYYLANGYHVYAKYRFDADQCSANQMTCNGLTRRNFTIEDGDLELYVDPLSNTGLAIANCGVVVNGNADDRLLGSATAVVNGQKTETSDLANGDFEIVFGDWTFTVDGQELFWDGNGNPLAAQIFVFNANVTRLVVGALNNDHRNEGSGNVFWRD
jgi:hypothetical protein